MNPRQAQQAPTRSVAARRVSPSTWLEVAPVDHFYLYTTFWFIVTCYLVWDVHRTNRRAHAHTQEILRDIARFLGTDRG